MFSFLRRREKIIDSDCLRCRHRYKDGFYYGEPVKGWESTWKCDIHPNPYNPTTADLILCGTKIDLDTVQGLIELRKWGNRMSKEHRDKYGGGFVGDNCPHFEKMEGL